MSPVVAPWQSDLASSTFIFVRAVHSSDPSETCTRVEKLDNHPLGVCGCGDRFFLKVIPAVTSSS
jgi:hypothetical protein